MRVFQCDAECMSSSGDSSACLERHHSSVAARIVATEQAVLSESTEPAIKELVRGSYASAGSSPHHHPDTTNAPEGVQL